MDSDKGMPVKQRVVKQQSPPTGFDTLRTQTRHPHSYPPRPPADMPSFLSDPDEISMQSSESQAGGHTPNTAIPNFPYLHGAQAYILKKSRRSMDTTITNDSPRSSSDYVSRQTAGVSGVGSRQSLQHDCSAADAAHLEAPKELEETHSASSIEIGSLHVSSSVGSEELRRFYNPT
jgi:hypothetical protein